MSLITSALLVKNQLTLVSSALMKLNCLCYERVLILCQDENFFDQSREVTKSRLNLVAFSKWVFIHASQVVMHCSSWYKSCPHYVFLIKETLFLTSAQGSMILDSLLYFCVSQAFVWYFDPVHPKTVVMGALVGKMCSQPFITYLSSFVTAGKFIKDYSVYSWFTYDYSFNRGTFNLKTV